MATQVRALRQLTVDKRDLILIEKHKTFTDLYAKAAENFKKVVRDAALIGQTVKFMFDEDGVTSEVSVRGMPGRDRYDTAKAWKLWPPLILRQVVEIDAQKVKRLIDEGEFDEALAQKALLPNVPDTARVGIKLLDTPKKKSV